MGIFVYTIFFELHYRCDYGDCVYLLGNIPELGDWDLSKALKLKWHHNDVWRGKLTLKIDNSSFIQYKYAIAADEKQGNSRESPELRVVKRWETGPNRILYLKNITKLEFCLNEVWDHRKVSLRLQKQENNDNCFYISGNTKELGDFASLQRMSLIRKKSSLFIEESYWEKTLHVPNDFFPKQLEYNFYEFDKENGCFLVNDTGFSVNVFEEMRFSSFEKLWSPQLCSEKREIRHKMLTVSPKKLDKLTRNLMRIEISKNKPKKVEKKYHFVNVFNEIASLKGFVKEINKEIVIGNNCLKSSDFATLDKEKVDTVVFFKKSRAFVQENEKIFEDSASSYAKSRVLDNFAIYSNQINRSDPSNLLAWAQCLDNLSRNNRRIFVCWSDCKEEMFDVLLHYLHHFKKFSFKAAGKFLNLEKTTR